MPDVSDINTLLPSELLYLIFKLLRHPDLKEAVAVCRRWKEVGEAQSLWTWACPRITQKNIKTAKDLLGCRRMQSVSRIRISALSEDVVDGVACHQGLRWASISCGLLSLHERRLLVMLATKIENVELRLAKDEVGKVFGEILLTTCSNLQNLDLRGNDLSRLEEGVLGLAVSTLESLQLQRTELETKHVREILTSVSGSNCKLKKLGLSENNISGVEASLTEIFHKLEEVELENTSLTEHQLVAILSCLSQSSKTKKLNLNQNCLSSIGPGFVARLTVLEEARIADCQLSPQQLGALFQATKSSSLRKLDISGHSFKTLDVATLSLSRAAGQLDELRASRCQFSQESLEAFCEIIVEGCRLKTLDFSHVSLTSVDPRLLAKTARLLEELFIPHTFLTSSQVEELFEAIKVPDSRVRVLHISSNRLSSVEPETLSTAVARLKEARMEKCSLSSPQVQALLNSAAHSSSLVSLHIGQDKFLDRNLVQKARRNIRDLC